MVDEQKRRFGARGGEQVGPLRWLAASERARERERERESTSRSIGKADGCSDECQGEKKCLTVGGLESNEEVARCREEKRRWRAREKQRGKRAFYG